MAKEEERDRVALDSLEAARRFTVGYQIVRVVYPTMRCPSAAFTVMCAIWQMLYERGDLNEEGVKELVQSV